MNVAMGPRAYLGAYFGHAPDQPAAGFGHAQTLPGPAQALPIPCPNATRRTHGRHIDGLS